MDKTLTEKIKMQIRHAKDCMDIDGSNKGFIKGLEFVKRVLIPDTENKKDQRIAELEKELEDARLSADFYMKSSTGYTDEFNKLKHENFELEDEIEQLRISLNTEHEDKHAAAKDALQLRKENAELKAKLENAIRQRLEDRSNENI